MSGLIGMSPEACRLQELITSEQPRVSDAIVWLQGDGYDRGAMVLDLFAGRFAPLIFITGNNDRVVDNDNVRVHDLVAWLMVHGVPGGSVQFEVQSCHTGAQADHVLRYAVQHGWSQLLLVGSTYHQLRAFLTFLRSAQRMRWHGRIVNHPAIVDWDAYPYGKRSTAKVLFEEECAKLQRYRDDVASVEEGLQYFAIWNSASHVS